MNMKAISIALLLLGVAFAALALSQLNQMSINSAQYEATKPALEAQIIANEELAKSYGQSDADISKASQDARDLLGKSISAMNGGYLSNALIDGIAGLVLLFAGIVTYPKEK
jgi:hypothetical protein